MKKHDMESITPAQAHYVLSQLAADRRIRQREIDEYLARMEREIVELESRLEALRSAADSGAAATAKPAAASKAARKSRKRRPARITPEVAASRALQGRYISMVKRFPKSERPKYAAIAQSKGREEAIKKMQSALKK